MHRMFCYHGNINSHSVLVKTYGSSKLGTLTVRLYLGNWVGSSMTSQDSEALRRKDDEDFESLTKLILNYVV